MAVEISDIAVAITGAGRGIGAATAAAFRRRGAKVAIGDVDVDALREAGARLGVAAYPLDVTSVDSFAAFLERAEEEVGPLDVLVNNAGIMPVGSFVAEGHQTTRRILDINVYGVMTGTKLALQSMIPRGHGHIVNVASMAGENYNPGVASYCGSKYAVVGFSDSIRAEVRSTGVRVSVVLPAFVKTELTAGTRGIAGVKAVEPEAVGEAIVKVVAKPRPHVYIPQTVGLLLKAGRLMPMAVGETLSRRLGGDTIFFEDLDRDARRPYEERVRAKGES